MKNLFFLLLLFINYALADDNSMVEYFNRFLVTFSSRSVSKDDYVSLVSYDVVPVMHSNYDLSPPEEYVNIDNDPDFVMRNTDVLFNGSESRIFFLDFIKRNILGSPKVLLGKITIYNKNNVTYSFKIENYQQDNVVVFENILNLIPDTENSSEFSCFYDFQKTEDGPVKLIDVNCAG
ncbi:hypothetical protein [Citrobacter cronae]|uniref:hypothetical protein n=1 Tax=Citrobacter cronae TaxID=1748967 RepID=UPI0021CED980|nr:hypothetical protein [Citrobacter cronae]MCU6177089.1 hypothetical protein [Citrobacter cronae]